MTQRRVWDNWGAKPKLWTERISASGIWRTCAVLLALPLSMVGFAISDNVNTPQTARLLIAPGYVVAFHLPLYSGRFLGDVGRFGVIAIAINICYYSLLILGISRLWRAAK